MSFELLNGVQIVPSSGLPKRRDPLGLPFFVEWSGRKRGISRHQADYRVVGTFRSGAVSLKAVPLIGPIRNTSDWLNRWVASELAKKLNELHADHRIDWSSPFPVIVPDGSVTHGILKAAAQRRADAIQAKTFPPNSRVTM